MSNIDEKGRFYDYRRIKVTYGKARRMFRSKLIWLATITVLTGLILISYAGKDSALPTSAEDTVLALPDSLKAPAKIARSNYLFNLLRNPVTNRIPSNIRSRELQYAARIFEDTRFASKVQTFNWFEAGPFDVGGRTRALAIDKENPSRMLAGAVSGGVWESTNAGATWEPIALSANNLSITYIAQDPRPSQTNVWYYASGEFIGNSASDAIRNAPYYGSGIYKSTDGGNTWFILPAANAGNENSLDTPFDYVNRLAVSPVTGTLFAASTPFGIFRSANGGESFGPLTPGFQFPFPALGGIVEHYWSDVAVNANGVVLATLSSGPERQPTYTPGIYLSVDDGLTWSNITPGTFPTSHGRSVVAFAPSNPDVAYVFTTTSTSTQGQEDVRLHKLNISTGASADLTANLTALSEVGNIETQSGYNMAIAVKPDDENFVLLGATNVYRSRNGFSSGLVEQLDYWIGGYDAVDDDFGAYQNHHPDQHLFVFDPNDTDKLWTANDGGIYVTNDITRQNEVTWQERNTNYNTTQFYTVGIHSDADDPRVAGGAQDNGTPFLRFNDLDNNSRNISIGDGSHLFMGNDYAIVGYQNGATLRLQYNTEGTPTFAGFSFIHPRQATNQLFLTPFAVDPVDQEVLYYPAGLSMWRHNSLSTIPSAQTDAEGITDGWNRLNSLPRIGSRLITAVTVSTSPAHILYAGASDTRNDPIDAPVLYRLTNADTDDGSGFERLPLPNAAGGAYISDIAVNPNDANEILVVLSNYEITGLFYSEDGGGTFSAVEGNLTGNTTLPGPSLRAATILDTDNETMYFVGTSTGVYSTTSLAGSNTEWIPETGAGQAVVWDITSRPSDQIVAVGTHGRGLFIGSQDPNFNPRPTPGAIELTENYPNPFASLTRIQYTLSEPGTVNLAVFDLAGRKIADLVTNEAKETGRHEAVFNAGSVASGVYLYQLRVSSSQGSATYSASKKMMVIK